MSRCSPRRAALLRSPSWCANTASRSLDGARAMHCGCASTCPRWDHSWSWLPARRRHDGVLQPASLVHLVITDFGKDQLLTQPERKVSASVERSARHTAKVACAGQCRVDQAVKELPHSLAAQRHRNANVLALAQL